jgi:hypothetical protein
MNLNPADFPELESVQITVIEETPDGKRYMTYFGSISDIPEVLSARCLPEPGPARESETARLEAVRMN